LLKRHQLGDLDQTMNLRGLKQLRSQLIKFSRTKSWVCGLLLTWAMAGWIIFSSSAIVAQEKPAVSEPKSQIGEEQVQVAKKAIARVKPESEVREENLKSPVVGPEEDLTSTPTSKEPIKVSVGIYITNLANIDQVSETFDIAGYLIYSWQDPRLAYQTRPNESNSRSVDIKQIWAPELEMVNFKAIENADTFANVAPDGTVIAQERFSKTLSSALELQTFPFDRQALQIVLESLKYPENIVKLVADSPKISVSPDKFVSLSEWQIGKITSTDTNSFFAPENQYYSRLTVDIHIKRNSGFYIFKVMFPLLLITIASWAVFWIDPQEFSTQIGIAFTNLLTVVALLLVINDALPRVGYLTLMDGFTMLCFMTILLSVLELVLLHRLATKEKHHQVDRIHNFSRWVVPIGFFLLNALLFLVMHFVKP
jgi:hypothetical protein